VQEIINNRAITACDTSVDIDFMGGY